MRGVLREEALGKLYQRVVDDHYREAQHVVSTALAKASEEIQVGVGSSDAEKQVRATRMAAYLNPEHQLFSTVPFGSIDALVGFIEQSKIITTKAETISSLREIERDLQHFRRHHSFRRRDWLPTVAH